MSRFDLVPGLLDRRQHAPTARLKGPPRYCLAEGCGEATKKRKPYCSEHVLLHPYAQEVYQQSEAWRAVAELASRGNYLALLASPMVSGWLHETWHAFHVEYYWRGPGSKRGVGRPWISYKHLRSWIPVPESYEFVQALLTAGALRRYPNSPRERALFVSPNYDALL